MRILHVLGKLDRGGVETWLVQVLRHIDRQQYQMDFMVHTTEKGAYDHEVRALGAKIIPCLRPSQPALYAKNFFRILREHGPYDVVHSHVHHYSGYVLALAAMRGVPVRIAHSHTGAPERSATITRKAYLAGMRLLLKRHATLGIAVSALAGDSLMPGWQRDATWCLQPLGIDTEPFDTHVDSLAVRRELGLPPESLIVGHVGRFVDVKNHDFIIQIALELVKWKPEVIFLVVGDGPLRQQIEGKVSRFGISKNFVFTGSRDDIPRIMKSAMDAFVFPSRYEGLGIVLMEAQLAGLCCVISDLIPAEADLAENALLRLSLSSPPSYWAKSLATILQAKLHCVVPDHVRSSRSISGSVAQLTAFYQSRCCHRINAPTETDNLAFVK